MAWGHASVAGLLAWTDAVFLHRYHRQRFTIMVSRSKDGELRQPGAAALWRARDTWFEQPGSAQGLRAIVRKVHSGYNAGFTPDGPRGPRYTVQPGIVAVAKTTGAAILPVTYSARWKKVFHSWDAYHAAAFQSCRGRLWRTDLRASDCFAHGLPGQATRGRNEPTTHHGDG